MRDKKIQKLEELSNNIQIRINIKKQRQEDIISKKETNYLVKKAMKDSISCKKQEKLRKIEKENQLMREQKRLNEEHLEYCKQEEYYLNRNKYDLIRAQQGLIEERRKEVEVHKLLLID